MKQTVRFRWPQLASALTVEPLTDLNPQLTSARWEATPLISIQRHAALAGDQIYFPTRFTLIDPKQSATEMMISPNQANLTSAC
jgi:hypothetical protein